MKSKLQQRVANFRDPRAPMSLANSSISLLGSSHDVAKRETFRSLKRKTCLRSVYEERGDSSEGGLCVVQIYISVFFAAFHSVNLRMGPPQRSSPQFSSSNFPISSSFFQVGNFIISQTSEILIRLILLCLEVIISKSSWLNIRLICIYFSKILLSPNY